MSRGIEVKQRDVKGVGYPGEWMPVRLFGGSQGPRDGLASQSIADVRILRDISIVIVVNKWVVVYGIVEKQRNHREKQAYHRVPLFGGRKQTGRL
jgi:hypothetical protein